ncbi:MAG: hypothetical protein Q8Q46_02215 [Candidatus Giovannonibacteria bacterium]|nr:hypothetical protein [Candidatus Giovannonibacteria bacterium]
MWKLWTNGVLGIWIILMPYAGLPENLLTFFMVITGIVIAVLAFWSASESQKML